MSQGVDQWLQTQKHQVGPPPMMEYIVLFTRQSEGITPGQLLGIALGPTQGITPVLLQVITLAPYKELPPVNQDIVMAGGDGGRGQGNEGLTRLTSIVTEDTIPTPTPKLVPPFVTLSKDLQYVIGSQSQLEQKWLLLWDEFKQKEACQWKVYESRVVQKKAIFEDDQAMKKAPNQPGGETGEVPM